MLVFFVLFCFVLFSFCFVTVVNPNMCPYHIEIEIEEEQEEEEVGREGEVNDPIQRRCCCCYGATTHTKAAL